MPVDDVNFDGFDGKLYFHDSFEWKEVGNLEKIHELSTEIISSEGEEAKFEGFFEGMPVFEWDYEASLKSDKSDLYFWRMKNGILTYLVPNNWRRMHGYRARRRSVANRRAERVIKKGFYCK